MPVARQKTLSERDALILGRESERIARLNVQYEKLQGELADAQKISSEILSRSGLADGQYNIELRGTAQRPLGSVWNVDGKPVMEEMANGVSATSADVVS